MKTFTICIMLIAGAITCLSCAAQNTLKSNNSDTPPSGKLESLLSVNLSDKKLNAQVTSTGCTHAEDFSVAITSSKNHCEISVYRTRPDLCRRAPFPVWVTLEIDTVVNCATHTITNSIADGAVSENQSISGPQSKRK